MVAPLTDRLDPEGACWEEPGCPVAPVLVFPNRPGTDGEERYVMFLADFRACWDDPMSEGWVRRFGKEG